MEISAKRQIKKARKFKKKYKVGLCLSGGGTRGFSFLGAFKAFEDCGISFDAVAGTSAGSLFGALYSTGIKYEDMYSLTYGLKDKDFRNSKLGILPSKMDNLQELIRKYMPVSRIEELPIPFYAVAVDLKTGNEIHFNKGDLSKVITGSCAIPGIFAPVKYKNYTLVDGGVTNNVPADVLRLNGCDFVVTIDCNITRGRGTTSENLFRQFNACIGIMTAQNVKKGHKFSDIIVCPKLEGFNSLKIKGKNDMIKEGYRATMEAMPQIKDLFLGKFKRKNAPRKKES